jgi:glycosyltransferase involved in cell wall biosynthesis
MDLNNMTNYDNFLIDKRTVKDNKSILSSTYLANENNPYTSSILAIQKENFRVSDTRNTNASTNVKNGMGFSICVISRGVLPSAWMQHMVERVTRFVPSGIYWNWIFTIGNPEMNGKNYADLRNDCVNEAIRRGSKWILFVDDDVFIPDTAIQKMLVNANRGMKIISGIYYKKTESVEPVIFKKLGDGPYFDYPINEIFEIEGSGAGCLWIDMEVFNKFDDEGIPYFKQDWFLQADKDGKHAANVAIGEDHWFYYNAKKLGFQPYCDSGLMCDHYEVSSNRMFPIQSEVVRLRGNSFRNTPEYQGMVKQLEEGKKPNLVFISSSLIPFTGNSIEDKPIGGSETAIIHTLKGLANDHNVVVFCQCPRPGMYDGVLYLDLPFMDIVYDTKIDVMVFYRMETSDNIEIINKKYNPKKSILWMQDHPMYSEFDHDFPKNAKLFDAIVCVSKDHRQSLIDRFPAQLDEDKIYVIENGVDNSLYSDKDKVVKKKHQFYYSSTPFRGLDILIDLFPKIRERVPDATLKVCSSMLVYNDVLSDKKYEPLYDKCRNTDGVMYVGSIKQKDLAKIAMESELLLYPSIYAETNCISVEEAQSAGTPVICNDLGALKETVHEGCGIIIKGSAKSKEWQDKFVEMVVRVCNDESLWQSMHDKCLEQNFNWGLSVEKWKKLINQFIGEPSIKAERCLSN